MMGGEVCLATLLLMGLNFVRNWVMLFVNGRFTDLATALGIVRGCLVGGVRAATVKSPGLGPWSLLAVPGSLARGPGSLGLSSVLAAPGSLWLLSS